MEGGAWWATVHGVAKSQTGLSDFTLTFNAMPYASLVAQTIKESESEVTQSCPTL